MNEMTEAPAKQREDLGNIGTITRLTKARSYLDLSPPPTSKLIHTDLVAKTRAGSSSTITSTQRMHERRRKLMRLQSMPENFGMMKL